MGILRSDRVSGLGGANAINGSTFFNGDANTGTYLRIDTGATEDFTFGTGDFTFEFWVYSLVVGFQQHFYDGRGSTNSQRFLLKVDAANTLFYYDGTANRIQSSSALATNEWVHVALVRESATTKMYVNGTQTGSTHTGDNVDFLAPAEGHGFIGSNGGTDGIEPSGGGYFRGFLSNFRIVKGTAVYTGNFTPPTTRLTAIDGTVLLTCTSPSNVEYEATGKTIIASSKNTNSKPPVASRFVPDKGEDHGTTFADNTKFDTLSYMVPPAGTTAERGRGRGVIGGGWNSPTQVNTVQYIEIQSLGNSVDFGDKTDTRYAATAVSSSTRGVMAGGHSSSSSPYPVVNTMDYITIATTSDAIDFGDLVVAAANKTGTCNNTRGVIIAGYNPNTRAMDLITIATTGNASDFGDSIGGYYGMNYGGVVNSPTRGVIAGGNSDSAPFEVVKIQYITFASAADALDFGDLTHSNGYFNVGGCSETRGLFMGGADLSSPYPNTNAIDYITIASTGNATDFGDLTVARYTSIGVSSGNRGVIAGGLDPSSVNTIDYVTIATTGNASDFGDLYEKQRGGGGMSDSHGGIS